MSRSISDSLALLEISRTNIENALKDKLSDMGGELDGIKISEVAEKINSIEVGVGGGIDVNNPKYISFTPNKSFHTYDPMEMSSTTYTINVTIDLTNYEEPSQFNPNYHLASNGLKFGDNVNTQDYLYGKKKSEFQVEFTGCEANPSFLIVLCDGDRNIVDIAKVDVYG